MGWEGLLQGDERDKAIRPRAEAGGTTWLKTHNTESEAGRGPPESSPTAAIGA